MLAIIRVPGSISSFDDRFKLRLASSKPTVSIVNRTLSVSKIYRVSK
jgi:hypothetical protein